ncbi:hypothetical protein JCM11251_006385 [Rhodosporidiobolus azoricus]
MDPLTAAAAALGFTSALAYLDAKLDLTNDIRIAKGVVNARVSLAKSQKLDRNSVWYLFEQAVKARGDDECYVCEGKSWSWNEVYRQSNHLAHWFLSQGLQRGDTIALYMPNKPAYPIIFLACLAIDVIPACLNYNLTSTALQHCITIAAPKLVLYESDLARSISEIAPRINNELAGGGGVKYARWVDGFSDPGEKGQGVDGEVILDEALLGRQSADRIPDERRKGVKWTSPACLIYTSGTTGLPKAALTLHGRVTVAAKVWSAGNGFGRKTRIYTPMPLEGKKNRNQYHSTALVLAVCAAWNAHSTVVIGRKFSASSFWRDVRESRADVVQYVGEVLRYLLAQPPSPLDKQHDVKLAYGNGCRPDVWEKFRDRFGVRTISEFFASSEGNGSLFNHNSNAYGAGAVGRQGWLLSAFQKNKQVVVKVDPLTEEPARTRDGLCKRADVDEPGEMVIQIDQESPYQVFAGYHNNKAATEKKIIRDVLVKGDTYFRTGDLLRHDAHGHWFFADRLGDTFRWRSENVSTTEVAEKLGAVVGEANVYGVLVPGHDGRAGCAAIPASAGPVDFDKLAQHVQRTLPKYAQPLFLRLVPELESTGTSKQTKVALRNEGVDPAKVTKDPVYWLHPDKGTYVRLTEADWREITGGKVKL